MSEHLGTVLPLRPRLTFGAPRGATEAAKCPNNGQPSAARASLRPR